MRSIIIIAMLTCFASIAMGGQPRGRTIVISAPAIKVSGENIVLDVLYANGQGTSWKLYPPCEAQVIFIRMGNRPETVSGMLARCDFRWCGNDPKGPLPPPKPEELRPRRVRPVLADTNLLGVTRHLTPGTWEVTVVDSLNNVRSNTVRVKIVGRDDVASRLASSSPRREQVSQQIGQCVFSLPQENALSQSENWP